jgi:hypothetical protein
MAIVANTVTADATGTVYLPLDAGRPPAPGSLVTIIAAGAVNLQAGSGATQPSFTLPANVPVALPVGGQRVYLATVTGTAAVSYLYLTS